MSDEFHISSFVVHSRREQAARIAATLAEMPGTEIHGGVDEGKLIVTLETRTEGEIIDRLNAAQLLEGVLAATLVLHHVETDVASLTQNGDATDGPITP